jgi:regulatory protein
VCPQIVRIENAGPDRKARRLVFDDGTESRLTSAAAVKALGLECGLDVAADALEASLAEVEFPLAKERGLLLLGYRDRSHAELTRKLRDSGYSASIAAAVVERFDEVELLDDTRFAAAWVRTRTASGYGSRRIARELAEKGIAPDVASAAIETIADDGDQLELARRALRGRTAADRKERDKLVRRLISRGFSLQVALLATESEDSDGPSTL